PQTEVEGEVGRDLEVVLHEQRDAVVEVRPRIRGAAAALAPDLVEEEVGERGPREGPAVPEYPQQAVIAGIEALLHVMKELAAELQRMTASHPRQLLVELVGLVPGVRVAGSRPDGRERAPLPGADLDRAEAGDGLTAGDVERRVRVPDAGPVERFLDVGDLVEADQHLVHERRAEDVAPVQSQVAKWPVLAQSQYEGKRVLVDLGIVFVEGEATEHLVVRGGVPVEPQVPLMGANSLVDLPHVIAGDAAYGPVRKRVE